MKHIKIFDTTLRDGEQSPGCSMHLSEKIEIALQLEKLGVDIIEAGFAVSSPGDFESVSEVAKIVKNCSVASLSRAVKGDIDAAAGAVKHSIEPRIHIFLATSPLHLEYKLKINEEQALERIAESIKYAKSLIPNIEFSAEDAARTPLPFLLKAFQTAIDNGATVINVPDTVGYCTPQEMAEKIKYLKANLYGIEKVDISAHNHNDLGMAVASSLAMVEAGATQVECTLRGIGERAGNAALEEIVMALKVRKNLYNAETRIDTKELYNSCRLLSNIIGTQIPATKPIIGANAYAHESGIHQHGVMQNPETYEIISPTDVGIPQNKIVLGKHSGKHAFKEHCKSLGFVLDEDRLAKCFEAFKVLADKKKYVSNKDLEAIVLGGKAAKPPQYSLVSFQTDARLPGVSSTSIILSHDGKRLSYLAEGNGAMDSAFTAINSLTGKHPDLLDYSVNAVSESTDAQAVSSVKLKYLEEVATGRGVSTDVVESSILAYLDALNKLI